MADVLLALLAPALLSAGFWGPALIARTRWGSTDPFAYQGSTRHLAPLARADQLAITSGSSMPTDRVNNY
ncbi:hypothetical protein [Streptomyces sp. SYSU K217416]